MTSLSARCGEGRNAKPSRWVAEPNSGVMTSMLSRTAIMTCPGGTGSHAAWRLDSKGSDTTIRWPV